MYKLDLVENSFHIVARIYGLPVIVILYSSRFVDSIVIWFKNRGCPYLTYIPTFGMEAHVTLNPFNTEIVLLVGYWSTITETLLYT